MGILTSVDRIGKRSLDGNVLTLTNRTNQTSIELSPEGAERWRKYLMAYGNKGNWGGKGRGNAARSDTRLTGLFKTKRQGLYVGSAKDTQLDSLIRKIKEAKAQGKGLAFFLWKNTFGDGPAFSLNVDVEKDQSERPKPRKQVEPDTDFEDDEEAEEDDLFGDK